MVSLIFPFIAWFSATPTYTPSATNPSMSPPQCMDVMTRALECWGDPHSWSLRCGALVLTQWIILICKKRFREIKEHSDLIIFTVSFVCIFNHSNIIRSCPWMAQKSPLLLFPAVLRYQFLIITSSLTDISLFFPSNSCCIAWIFYSIDASSLFFISSSYSPLRLLYPSSFPPYSERLHISSSQWYPLPRKLVAPRGGKLLSNVWGALAV